MNRLAICVPTADHAEVVEQTICYGIGYLDNNNVDIYYYDSSADDETLKLVNILNSKGFDNVYHIALTPGMSYGKKIDLIFQGYGLVKDYDYIWPQKDRVVCNETMLHMILENCDGSSDALIGLTLGKLFESDHIDIGSAEQLYLDFAKQVTGLGTVIYNRKSFLRDYDSGSIDGAPKFRDDYWHYWIFFNKLAQMNDPKVRIVSKEDAVVMISAVVKPSFWYKRIFEVWIDEWIKLNYELPDIYSPYKLKVIKDTTSIKELLGDPETFVKLHDEGLLTKEVYKKYEDMWGFVTNVPASEIERIANL